MNLFVLLLVADLALALGWSEGPQGGKRRAESTQIPQTCASGIQTSTKTITVSISVTAAEATPTLETPKEKKCGNSTYDPLQYVCRAGGHLCPVFHGEPLSRCGTFCYSTFYYNCPNNTLPVSLPLMTDHMTLTVASPFHPKLHNRPITVCNNELRIGGKTCSFCPPVVRSMGMCPPGNVTVLNNSTLSSMAVMVPGGQMMFLTKDWGVGVGKAHSTWLPPGAKLGGWKAYEGGGFVNEFAGGEGWVACKEKGNGMGVWKLRAGNATTWEGCVGVNLRAKKWEGLGAWQYT